MSRHPFIELADLASEPDAPAIVDAGRTVSFATLAEDVRHTRAALLDAVMRGDRIAILSPNSAATLTAVLAATSAGVVPVPINTRLSASEVAWTLVDAAASLLLIDDTMIPLLDGHRLACPMMSIHGLRADPAAADPSDSTPHPGPIAIQMYTSGTSGRPKGALLTHVGVEATITNVAERFQLDGRANYLALLPMCHISGLGTALAVLARGGTVTIPSGTSAADIADDVERFGVSHVNLVPTLMSSLLTVPRAHDRLTTVRHVMYGAAPSGSDLVEQSMRLMPTADFHHGYGLTECTGGISYEAPVSWSRGERPAPEGRVGIPVADCEIRIVDPHDLRDVADREPGEIWVRSPQNIFGYWHRPDADAELYTEKGWLRTGDVGALVDGHLELRDRLGDMIITGGENVYPTEVERVLDAHPAVAESAVYGVADAHWGERVCAAIRLSPGHSETRPADLVEFVRRRLAGFKCPKEIRVVDDLPHGGTGKLLRRELAAEHLDRLDRDGAHLS